jgi:NAD(P)-dependent dehydrogenase (short-subunit alcohol dehydrogenase family)
MSQETTSQYALSKHALAAYATSLQVEVQQFGITAVNFDLGYFRTPFVGHVKFKETDIEQYKEMVGGIQALAGQMHLMQPGDVEKGVS